MQDSYPAAKTQKTMAAVASTALLRVKKLSAAATIPTRGSPLAAGYDLHRYFSPCCG